ncbi:MAG TPA: hypothetical protein VHD76_20795 [Bryobacteraceae bacterium]|nr:hypothetical protein [Bryobacteraceae bacterium]HVY18890.1 hypothetical protein [Bauldia sp.]
MSEIKAIEAVDNALSGLDAEARGRVLTWARQKYGDSGQVTTAQHSVAPAQNPAANGASAKPKSKKTKTIIAMDKSLNLNPSGKESAVKFATDKSPTTVLLKCVVAVYYLRETIGMAKVTTEAVFTFFKHVNWPVPADLRNTLQQAGTSGWLDTADMQDIKLTSSGENVVEHQLPAKAKAK